MTARARKPKSRSARPSSAVTYTTWWSQSDWDGIERRAFESTMESYVATSIYLFYERPKSLYFPVKRLVDLFVGSALLVLVSPLLVAMGLLIRLTTNGPIFYTQIRVGKSGAIFRIFKLRTFRKVAVPPEKADGDASGSELVPEWYTPFLRGTKIDELPQLYNVVRGQMSIVGPRPLPVDETKLCPREYGKRLCVLPGLTGLWQSLVPIPATVFDKMKYDAQYVETLSFWNDLRILWNTPRAIARNAYARTTPPSKKKKK